MRLRLPTPAPDKIKGYLERWYFQSSVKLPEANHKLVPLQFKMLDGIAKWGGKE